MGASETGVRQEWVNIDRGGAVFVFILAITLVTLGLCLLTRPLDQELAMLLRVARPPHCCSMRTN